MLLGRKCYSALRRFHWYSRSLHSAIILDCCSGCLDAEGFSQLLRGICHSKLGAAVHSPGRCSSLFASNTASHLL